MAVVKGKVAVDEISRWEKLERLGRMRRKADREIAAARYRSKSVVTKARQMLTVVVEKYWRAGGGERKGGTGVERCYIRADAVVIFTWSSIS